MRGSVGHLGDPRKHPYLRLGPLERQEGCEVQRMLCALARRLGGGQGQDLLRGPTVRGPQPR